MQTPFDHHGNLIPIPSLVNMGLSIREATQLTDDATADYNKSIVILSDIHFPHHDPYALDLIMGYLQYAQPDRIILNGDILDCEGISDFISVDARSLSDELAMGRAFLSQLKSVSPNSSITWIDGNHEDRLPRYLAKRAPELIQLGIDMPSLLGLAGIDHHSYKSYILLPDNVAIQHGNSVSSRAGASVAGAMGKLSGSIFMGHVHRIGSSHLTNRLSHRPLMGYEIGCLCDLNPSYIHRAQADWQQGFMSLTYHDGVCYPEQATIRDRKFRLGGYLWS